MVYRPSPARRRAIQVSFAIVFSFCFFSQAETKIWTGAGATANFSEAANWSTNAAPADGDSLLFSNPASLHMSPNNDLTEFFVFQSIEFAATGYTITGNDLFLRSSIIQGQFVTTTINAAISTTHGEAPIGSGFGVNIGTNNQNAVLNINGGIKGFGSIGLGSTGNSIVHLNSAVTIDPDETFGVYGNVDLNAQFQFPDTTHLLLGGGKLQLNGFSQEFASLTGSGKIDLGNANLTVGGSDTSTLTQAIILGPGELIKIGTGNITLTGLNQSTGTLRVSEGSVDLQGQNNDMPVIVDEEGYLSGTARIKSLDVTGIIEPLGVQCDEATFRAGSTFQMTLGQSALPRLILGNNVDLSNCDLKILDTETIAFPGTRKIIGFSDPNKHSSGHFLNKEENVEFAVNTQSFTLTYMGGDNFNEVILQAFHFEKLTPGISIVVLNEESIPAGQRTIALVLVTGSSSVPTGTVTFNSETKTLDGLGSAEFEFAPPVPVGAHTLTASYGGNGVYLEGTGSQPVTTRKSTAHLAIRDGNTNISNQLKVVAGKLSVTGDISNTDPDAQKIIRPTGSVNFSFTDQSVDRTLSFDVNDPGLANVYLLNYAVTSEAQPQSLTATYSGDARYQTSLDTALIYYPTASDTDGDGYSDADENTFHTNPNDPLSFPGGSQTPIAPEKIKLSVKVDFTHTEKCAMALTVTFPQVDPLPVTGLVLVEIGTTQKIFNVDLKGKLIEPEKGDKFKAKADTKKDTVSLTMGYSGLPGTSLEELADFGIVNETVKNKPVTVKFKVVNLDRLLSGEIHLKETAKKDKTAKVF